MAVLVMARKGYGASAAVNGPATRSPWAAQAPCIMPAGPGVWAERGGAAEPGQHNADERKALPMRVGRNGKTA